jgi:hypothetical protein
MTNPPAPPVHHPARRAEARERGSLLIWAAIVSMMILGVITAGMGSEAAQDRIYWGNAAELFGIG